MWNSINQILTNIDNFVWGVPLMVIILFGGILLTVRLGLLQLRKLPLALKWMVKNEEEAEGEITSFAALCTALSATIGTGNIVGVATAVCAGGPGALFWMVITAFFGMATKYSEGLLAVKYRVIGEDGHSLGGPFYYIEQGMGKNWKWLAKLFAFFGVCVGLFGIGTFSQVNGISSAVNGFFDANNEHCVNIPFLGEYSWSVVIASLILAVCVALVLIGGVKRIASVSQVVVPFMAIIYVLFEAKKATLCHIEKIMNEKWGAGTVQLTITDQYRNMAEIIKKCMFLIDNAVKACKNTNIPPLILPIRGGTDGCMLSYMGLPCPNLGTGGHAYHGPYEHITIEGMDKTVDMLVELVKTFSKPIIN